MIKLKAADSVSCEIFGDVVELTKPSLGALDDLDSSDDKKKLGKMVSILISMGLTKECSRKLSVDQAEWLLKEVTGVKKN